MTDKKFTLEYENEEICQIYENDNCMSGEDVVDLLNELHKENKELKKMVMEIDKLMENLSSGELRNQYNKIKEEFK